MFPSQHTTKTTEPANEYVQVWLLQDRLCYTSDYGTQANVHYIPLGRITVRPLPKGYKPRIGVQHVDASLIALPEARAGNALPQQPQGRLFSVQYGSRTVYWAADTSREAKVTTTSILHHHGRIGIGYLKQTLAPMPAMQVRVDTVSKSDSMQSWETNLKYTQGVACLAVEGVMLCGKLLVCSEGLDASYRGRLGHCSAEPS